MRSRKIVVPVLILAVAAVSACTHVTASEYASRRHAEAVWRENMKMAEEYEWRLKENHGPDPSLPEAATPIEFFERLTGIDSGAHLTPVGIIAFPEEFSKAVAAWKAWHDRNGKRLRVDASDGVTVK